MKKTKEGKQKLKKQRTMCVEANSVRHKNKGITLIALVITIIVMLILVAVTVSYTVKSGLLGKAQNAKIGAEIEQERETLTAAVAAAYDVPTGTIEKEALEKELGTGWTVEGDGTSYTVISPKGNKFTISENGTITVAKDAKETNPPSGEIRVKLSTITGPVEKNTLVEDEYGNKITIPEGFKLASDSGADVTEGIVIEDVNNGNLGSQFVWIPVGTIYLDVEKLESIEITLGRYSFEEDAIDVGDAVIKDYYQELTTSNYGNASAINIEAFKTSVATNGGYYIGRYEAGDSSTSLPRTEESSEGTLVCKSNQQVYNWITQPDAATKCRNMYTGKRFTSDLVNSYAWDTVIKVLVELCGEWGYEECNLSSGPSVTGGNNDEVFKINDLSGNYREWTTETSTDPWGPCVWRGGCGAKLWYTCWRDCYTAEEPNDMTFRPILYV